MRRKKKITLKLNSANRRNCLLAHIKSLVRGLLPCKNKHQDYKNFLTKHIAQNYFPFLKYFIENINKFTYITKSDKIINIQSQNKVLYLYMQNLFLILTEPSKR